MFEPSHLRYLRRPQRNLMCWRPIRSYSVGGMTLSYSRLKMQRRQECGKLRFLLRSNFGTRRFASTTDRYLAGLEIHIYQQRASLHCLVPHNVKSVEAAASMPQKSNNTDVSSGIAEYERYACSQSRVTTAHTGVSVPWVFGGNLTLVLGERWVGEGLYAHTRTSDPRFPCVLSGHFLRNSHGLAVINWRSVTHKRAAKTPRLSLPHRAILFHPYQNYLSNRSQIQ